MNRLFGLALVMGIVVGISACGGRSKLPIYFETEPTPTFEMKNQDGKTLTEADLKGKVVVADFFFSTCPGVCKDMTASMRKIQDDVREMWDVKLVSFSVDPETDSVPVLKAYSIRNGVIPNKWELLSGTSEGVFKLAKDQFHISALKEASAPGGIFHDERLILMDKKGRIRGFYHLKDTLRQRQLLLDIQYLRKEMR